MNTYEMTFIVRPDLDEDGTRGAVEGVTGRLTSAGGEVLATVLWNPPRRRMAYPIKDFGDGFYVTTVFKFDPQGLRAYETSLKLNENVLRYLLVEATENNVRQAQQRMQQASAPRPQPAQVPVDSTGPGPAAVPDATAAASHESVPPVLATASPEGGVESAPPTQESVSETEESNPTQTHEPIPQTESDPAPAPEPVATAAGDTPATQSEE